MKRCTPLPSLRLTATVMALAVAGTLLATVPASAQTSEARASMRQFPPAAMRGEMVVNNHPLITLNGKAEQLSPGARIFDQNNRLVLSGQLVNQEVLVNYMRDGGGQIHQVWVLNSEEALERRAGSKRTVFNFVTDLFGGSSAGPDGKPLP